MSQRVGLTDIGERSHDIFANNTIEIKVQKVFCATEWIALTLLGERSYKKKKEKIFTRKLIVRATVPRRIEKEKNTTHMPFFVTLGYPGENLTGMVSPKGQTMETKYLALTPPVYKDRDRLIIFVPI